MAYDFLGTFNNHQFARLDSFLTNQGVDIPGRLAHLIAEQSRIGTLTFSYDSGGNPIGYNASPPTSYIAKLVAAYEILGGDPLFDLQIRSMSQPVFVVAGDSVVPSQQLSSGDVLGMAGLNDGLTAQLVQQMRQQAQEAIQYKRENIERKVRRAMDYSDQLGAEITLLKNVLNDATALGSLANLTNQVTTLLADPTYRAAYNDTNNDIHGKLTHAPFSQWDPGPDRQAPPVTVRVDGGVSQGGNQVQSGGGK